MPDRKQLEFLENMAAEQADAQAVQLAKARQQLAAAEKQLEMLKKYMGGYRNQLGEKLGASMNVEMLRGHQRFMVNIENAVRQQELEVARRRTNADAVQRAWQASERRRQGFRIMSTKLVQKEARAADRVLQKQSDEFAARGAQRAAETH